MSIELLDKEFTREVLAAHRQAKRLFPTRPARYLQMVGKYGAAETARRLLGKGPGSIQSGLIQLASKGRLDLSLERKVLKPKYKSLFTEQILENARQRLDSSKLKVKSAKERAKSKTHKA
jgi:hypothetical protein